MVHYFSCFLITDKNAFTPIKTIHMLFPLNCQHTNVIPNAKKKQARQCPYSYSLIRSSKNTTIFGTMPIAADTSIQWVPICGRQKEPAILISTLL